MRKQPCRVCGVECFVAKTVEGKTILLDVTTPCFYESRINAGGSSVVARNTNAFVSHFSTCAARRGPLRGPEPTASAPNQEG